LCGYRSHKKKARCRDDTGLWEKVSEYGQGVTSADSGRGATFHC